MLKKFFKEMPKDDKLINTFCVGFSLLIAVIIGAATYSSGVSPAVSTIIGLTIALIICGFRFSMLWALYKDSLNGSPRRSTHDYIVNDLLDD